MNPDFLVIDLFCGAGGTTSGFEKSRIGRKRLAKVIACVNHDTFAIQSHSSNHKSVLHFTEDIRTLDLGPLLRHVERMQKRYPMAKLVLWASLECTNFSKAKGGQSRDADSRTLAEHLFRYFILQPDYIMIENVEEFMSWGPLDKNGKPKKKYEGRDFVKWVNNVKKSGYNYEYKLINSADFGAYTSRTRFFAIFARPELPIVWPEPTHAKRPATKNLFNHPLRKWKPVREVLDLQDEGRDIFDRLFKYNKKQVMKYLMPKKLKRGAKSERIRQIVAMQKNENGRYVFGRSPWCMFTQGHYDRFEERLIEFCQKNSIQESDIAFLRYDPLSDKTFERIYAGLIKFVAGGKEAFIMKMNGGDPSSKCVDLENPTGTLTTKCHQALVQSSFIVQRNSGKPESKLVSLNSPARTITATGGNQDIVQPAFLVKYLSNSPKTGYSNGSGINDPCPVVTTQNRLAACFIATYHGNGHNFSSAEDPCPTIPAADTHAKIQAEWIDNQFGQSKGTSIEEPLGSVLTNPKQNVMKAQFIDMQHSQGKQNESIDVPIGSLTTVPKKNLITARFLMNHNFNNGGSSLEVPAPTLLASRRYYYIINPSWGGNPGSVEQPCPVIVARQDKAPLYLTVTEGGEMAIEIYATDSETIILIKKFMALYGIARITMRMLKVDELKLIMGLPRDYVLCGNQGKQKWMIGNMVHPLIPKAMARCLSRKLTEMRKQNAA